MKKAEKYLITIAFLIGVISGLGIYLALDLLEFSNISNQNEFSSFQPNSIPSSQYEILNNCKDLDLINMSYCFRDNIMTFYNYSSDGIEIRRIDGNYFIEERGDGWLSTNPIDTDVLTYLKQNGGECEQWSLLYLELCEKTGFKCNEVTNGGVLNIIDGHKYMIMSNSTNYCKLDLLKVSCGENKK